MGLGFGRDVRALDYARVDTAVSASANSRSKPYEIFVRSGTWRHVNDIAVKLTYFYLS
jgi:hypothetical protein